MTKKGVRGIDSIELSFLGSLVFVFASRVCSRWLAELAYSWGLSSRFGWLHVFI